MDRQRRFTFQEALKQLQIFSDDVNNDSDAEATGSSETESIVGDEEVLLEEELSDIDVFEEENEDAGSDEYQEPNDNDGSSGDEAQVAITARNATYYNNPFPTRFRSRLTQQPQIVAAPKHEMNAFKIFYRPEIILQIVRETNRKARDVRHECKLSPNSVYKNFTSHEVEAGFAIMIRAGLDRDNFTDLHRLWDPVDSRPFYRVTMALNRFKFLLRCMRFDNYCNRSAKQGSDRLAAMREVHSTVI